MSNTLTAALWMIGAIISFTLMAISGRTVSAELDTFEIMLYRSIIGIGIVLMVSSVAGTLKEVRQKNFGLHLTRNICHFTGQNLWFYAVTVVPLAQLFALEFTTPIWAILLSPLFLQEKITPIGLISAGIGFIGILIVARPDFNNISPGLLSGLGCALFFALTAIFTRKLTQTETITCILVYLTVLQGIFGLICAGFDGDIARPSAQMIPWVVLIGFAGLIAHFCMTKALSLAPASIVMPIDFVRLPTIAVVGMILYDEPLDLLVFLGAALIFGGNFLNVSQSRTQQTG